MNCALELFCIYLSSSVVLLSGQTTTVLQMATSPTADTDPIEGGEHQLLHEETESQALDVAWDQYREEETLFKNRCDRLGFGSRGCAARYCCACKFCLRTGKPPASAPYRWLLWFACILPGFVRLLIYMRA